MEDFTFLSSVVAKMGPPVEELYLWQELRLAWELKGGRVHGLTSRLRQASSLRGDGLLLSRDGCRREDLATFLDIPLHKLPHFSWPPPPTALDPHAVIAHFPNENLRLAVTATQVAVVRPDGVFCSYREPVLEAENSLGETFTWLASSKVPSLIPAHEGRKLPPSGKLRVLLQPQPAAVLIHEIFGHPLEGDDFFSGLSPWAGKLGGKVAPLPLMVRDDPTLPLPGGFLHDDEGQPARPKVLVDHGVLRGVLAHRSLQRYFPVEAGNARCASPHHPPLPRISNLEAWVEGGETKPPLTEAHIEIVRVRSGVFLPGERAFVLSVTESYRLLGGNRADRLTPFFLKFPFGPGIFPLVAGGNTAQVVAEPGWCQKKGQSLPVGAAACWLLCAGVEVA